MCSRTGTVVGSIALLAAASVVFWGHVRVELSCQGHHPATCSLLGASGTPSQFSLQAVAVDHWVDHDMVDQYQVMLVTKDGRVELGARSGGQAAAAIKQQIEDYLADLGQGELRLSFDNAAVVYTCAALLALLGGWAMVGWR